MSVRKILFKKVTVLLICIFAFTPLTACDSLAPYFRKDTLDPEPHYTYNAESTRKTYYEHQVEAYDAGEDSIITGEFTVDKLPETADAEQAGIQADNLVDAVMNDEKIIIAPTANVSVKLSWGGVGSEIDGVLDVLRCIITDEMTDYQKVHVIHDYLCYNVVYNRTLYDNYVSGSYNEKSSSFNIIGVFYGNLAVCDGISKAFMLMCKLEGIEAIRVTGTTFKTDINNAPIAGTEIPHAWNKVKLDLDGEGEGEAKWYNVDATYDRINFDINGETHSYLAHGYFLISDMDISGGIAGQSMIDGSVQQVYEKREEEVIYTKLTTDIPYEDNVLYAADESFNFFETDIAFTAEGVDYYRQVNSEEELIAFFKGLKSIGVKSGKQEVKLNFSADENGDYGKSFAKAYDAASDRDFQVASKPWAFMPGNTVFLMIYR